MFNHRLQFGDDHEKTKESNDCIKHLTQQAVAFQKRMQEASRSRSHGSISQLIPLQVSDITRISYHIRTDSTTVETERSRRSQYSQWYHISAAETDDNRWR